MQNSEERIDFPEVLDVDIAFGGYPEEWFNNILKAEKSKQKYQDIAESLFFNGGQLIYNEELDPEYINKGERLLRAILDSFKPKHEHKIKVCSVILENLCKE